MKVSAGERLLPDGSKPSVLYSGAQHAREWITPEMIRRLMHYFVDGYATDASIRNLLTQNELWFVPNSNPDGYDFTFQDGQRLWRKNLHDHDGAGQITAGDAVAHPPGAGAWEWESPRPADISHLIDELKHAAAG